MVSITPLTILVEFIPALVVALFYLIFFRERRNRLIEAFIIMMAVKVATFFLLNIWFAPNSGLPSFFDPTVSSGDLYWVIITDFVFQFTYALQDYLTWIMVSFVAVLFGQLVLIVKLTLQDPMKRKFSNLIKRLTGNEPETDEYSGLGDRLDHIRFENVEPQPLDPKVQEKAWSESWKDYLIIGLVTILPSIPIYMSTAIGPYVQGVLIFLTWIYRFGYPGSNRIAKGAGLKLGERDLGDEMMQGVLGWFFRLNLLWSLFSIGIHIVHGIQTGTLGTLIGYYGMGLAFAFPPILFVILIFPLVEDFSVFLYKRIFDSIRKFREKAESFDWSDAATNFLSALASGVLVTGAFVGAVMMVCLHFSFTQMGEFALLPSMVDRVVVTLLNNARNNGILIAPTIWALMMLLIPFASMILLGVLGHYVLRRTQCGKEGFAFFSALTVAVAVWFLLPGMDFLLTVKPTPTALGPYIFYRLRPIVTPPIRADYLLRVAFQFIVFVPIYIVTVLFILYFFDFREKWRISQGEETGPLLSVHQKDVIDTVLMFLGGVCASLFGVYLAGVVLDPGLLEGYIITLFNEIGAPDGLEAVLEAFVLRSGGSIFPIIAEHNVIRTLLMLLLGPVFWSAILWLLALEKESNERKIGIVSIVGIFAGAIAAYLWTFRDMTLGFFQPNAWPWGFAAQLGLRAAIIYSVLLAIYLVVFFIKGVYGVKGKIWWVPVAATLIAMEYFIYDDQFVLIALIVLPLILTAGYSLVTKDSGDPLLNYIRFSLMSLAISEVLSTALILGGLSAIYLNAPDGGLIVFLAGTLPHAIIEIPAFLLSAAISIRIARNLSPLIMQENWAEFPSKTRELLADMRTWRSYALIIFFLLLASVIEAYVTPIIQLMARAA
ncbi:MAG: stage II sporulation protein M [Candidatus Thorarchaeota archaeon]